MHSSIIASALFAALAVASPVKRAIVEDVVMTTAVEVVTVTNGAPAPASTAASSAAVVQAFAAANPAPAPAPAQSSSAAAAAPAPSSSAAPAPAPSSSSSAPAASGTPSSGGPTGSGQYQSAILYHHNVHRSNHSAPALTWDGGLESSAETIAKTCTFAHNMNVNGGGYGQNIAMGNPDSEVAKVISDQFYNNEMEDFASLYGQANPSANFEAWGHFSQVVWKGTQTVGCYTASCPNLDGGAYTVCNYQPEGNMAGSYGSNIGNPQGRPMVTG